jgi:hypothetical protein
MLELERMRKEMVVALFEVYQEELRKIKKIEQTASKLKFEAMP